MSARVALITGGARGIGRGIGLSLAASGWSIAFCYRSDPQLAEETADALRKAGAEVFHARADVSDAAASRALVADVEQRFGRIDALIHAAGPYHRVPLLEETSEAFRAMFDSNLHALFDLAQAVAPGMQSRGFGRILGFSMANAERLQANPYVAAHYIAKVGVLLLIKSLAKTLAPHGITANAIAPGYIDSGGAPEAELARMLKHIPAGRLGEINDAVAAARFLLSDEAAYVNGCNLVVSGGYGV